MKCEHKFQLTRSYLISLRVNMLVLLSGMLISLVVTNIVYASDKDLFRDKTFILDFEHEGAHAQAKYYVNKNGRVFFEFSTKCGLIGSTTEIGHSGTSHIKCDDNIIESKLSVYSNRNIFKAKEFKSVKSVAGNFQTIRDVSFSFDGMKCTPISYIFYLHNDNYASQGLSFESNPISCDAMDGRH